MTKPAPPAATLAAHLPDKLDHLKTLLVNAEDFAKPMDYFFDVLSIDPAFRRAAEPLADQQIEARFRGVLEILHRQVSPASVGEARLLAVAWLPDHQFAHGACELDGRLGVVFYFRDLDMGLSALTSAERMDEVMFSRFSVYDQVGSSKTLHIDRSRRRH